MDSVIFLDGLLVLASWLIQLTGKKSRQRRSSTSGILLSRPKGTPIELTSDFGRYRSYIQTIGVLTLHRFRKDADGELECAFI